MKTKFRCLSLALACMMSAFALGQTTIFSWAIDANSTGVGTYTVTGGTVEIKKAFATGGSNEVTAGNQTFYKFNSSTEALITLGSGTFAAGDVISITGACTANKNGKGFKLNNSVVVTGDFTANTPNTLTYTIVNGDGIEGQSSISLMRNDSDIKFGSITITRSSGGTSGGGSTTTTYTVTYSANGHGTAPTAATGVTALPNPLPTLTETGWIFGGWYLDANCTQQATAGAAITANTTLYAKWTQSGTQGGGETTGSDQCWNFSDDGWTAGGTKDGLTVGSGTTIDGSNASIDDYNFTKRVKLNGTLNDTRFVSFSVSGPCSITVYGKSGGSSERSLTIKDGEGTVLTNTFLTNDGSVVGKDTYSYTGGATTITIGSSGSGFNLYGICVAYNSGEPTQSSDASLSDLHLQGETTNYVSFINNNSVTINVLATPLPVLEATATHSKANVAITQATAVPGDATIVVTAEDGTTKTYTVHFALDNNEPVINSFVVAGVTATVDNTNHTITATLPYGTNLSTVTATVNGTHCDNLNPNVANAGWATAWGSINLIVSSTSGAALTYVITLTQGAEPSHVATLSDIKIGGTTITGFNANTTSYTIDVPAGQAMPNVTYTLTDSKAQANMTTGSDVVTIVVTAEDGTTKMTYTITANRTVPQTTLALHEPGVYEESKQNGGYSTTLKADNGYEYEIYYLGKGKNPDSHACIVTNNGTYITNGNSETNFQSIDNWIAGSVAGLEGGSVVPATSNIKANATDIFYNCPGDFQFNGTSGQLSMHIKGYTEFRMYAYDGDAAGKNKQFKVYVDNIEQNFTVSKSNTVRKFTITSDEHVIRIQAVGDSKCKFFAFALRLAQDPRVKHLKGNDTTQVVYQSQSMKIITYYVKYNQQTELIWDNGQNVSTGITLTNLANDGIGDTIRMGGTMDLPVGVHTYRVSAKKTDGTESHFATGKIEVKSKIDALTDTVIEAYVNEAIDEIKFRCFVLDANSVSLTGNLPTGVSSSYAEGVYTISGTPTATGTFTFTVTALSGNSIKCTIRVKDVNLGNNPVLYLYKYDYEHSAIYTALTEKGINVVERKAKDQLRALDQFSPYQYIVISDDVDANNEEVKAIIRGEAGKPVLNMQSYSYSRTRLGWGNPNSGSMVDHTITVQQPTHPIFQGINIPQDGLLTIVEQDTAKLLMPVETHLDGTICLATALTSSETLHENGVPETFIHEIPKENRNGQRYLLLPIASSAKLTKEGDKLLSNCIKYLLSNDNSVALPELKITSFRINGQAATINDQENTITLELNTPTDVTTLEPQITVKDPATHVEMPFGEPVVNFEDAFVGVVFTVTDFINIRTYVARVTAPEVIDEAIAEIYASGDWMDIYDISGRKIMTTNEDLHQLSLQRGMYLIVTAKGTMKIMR